MSTLVTCKQCLQSVTHPPGTEADVHASLECGCCTQDHHHGEAAAACNAQHACGACGQDHPSDGHADDCKQAHLGPCWQGPQAGPRPDGCTVCRPLLIQATAGTHILAGNGG